VIVLQADLLVILGDCHLLDGLVLRLSGSIMWRLDYVITP